MVAPWIVSVVVHGAAVALAFFVVWTVTSERAPLGPPATVSFYDPAPARESGESPEAAEDPDPEKAWSEPLEVATARAEVPSPAEVLSESLRAPDREAPAPAEDAALSDRMFERRFPKVEVYGMGAGNAQRIVYVVDGSGSMVSTFPMLKRELSRSLEGLSPTQWFQVVFFQGFDAETGRARAVAAPDPRAPERTLETRMLRASRANVRWVLEWIGGVRPVGRSDPIPALEIALALEPDAVFLVSNELTGVGQWKGVDEVLAEVDALNPADPRSGHRPVAIKVIGLPPEDETGLLQRIGAIHGGENGYKLIGEDDLGGRE